MPGPSTREMLLASAVAAIAEQGWQAASVRSVTGRANLPLGSITYHFGGKEELFREATARTLRTMFATPQRLFETASTVDELVGGLLGWSIADDATEDARILLLEAMTQSRRNPALAALLGRALAAYRAEIVAVLRRLGLDPATANRYGALLVAACDGLWLHAVIEPDNRPREAANLLRSMRPSGVPVTDRS